MVFKEHVRQVAEQHLRLTLALVPSAVSALMHPSIWNRWLELMTIRCNELDRLGWIPSGWALDQFIEDGARAYARIQLDKMGQHSELMAAQKEAPKVLQ